MWRLFGLQERISTRRDIQGRTTPREKGWGLFQKGRKITYTYNSDALQDKPTFAWQNLYDIIYIDFLSD